MADEDEIERGNRDEKQIHCTSTNLPSDWPFNNNPNDLANTSSNPIWDHHHHHHPTNPQNLAAFCDVNMQNNATTSSSSLGFRKGNIDMWAHTNSAIKRGGGMFLPPGGSAMLQHTLSRFPADSGFIERAARLSSFSAGNFEDIINPFGNAPETSLSPYSNRTHVQPQEGFVGNGLNRVLVTGLKICHCRLTMGPMTEVSLNRAGRVFRAIICPVKPNLVVVRMRIRTRVMARRNEEEVIRIVSTIKSNGPRKRLVKIQRTIVKLNKRVIILTTRIRLLINQVGNMVNKYLNHRMHRRKSTSTYAHGEVKLPIAIVLQKE